MATRLSRANHWAVSTRFRASNRSARATQSGILRQASTRGLEPGRNKQPESNHRAMSTSSTCKESSSSHLRPAEDSQPTSAAGHPTMAETHPNWRRRRVVSSFLCHGTPHTEDFRVSIFKRSTQVRTYPGKWAACSGSVEATDASPVHAALRELHEETGLRPTDLVRIGGGDGGLRDVRGEVTSSTGSVCYELLDAQLETIWEVWPFLWRVKGSKDEQGEQNLSTEEIRRRIQLDWEHDEMRFATLEEIETMDTVEDLGRGVREILNSLR